MLLLLTCLQDIVLSKVHAAKLPSKSQSVNLGPQHKEHLGKYLLELLDCLDCRIHIICSIDQVRVDIAIYLLLLLPSTQPRREQHKCCCAFNL